MQKQTEIEIETETETETENHSLCCSLAQRLTIKEELHMSTNFHFPTSLVIELDLVTRSLGCVPRQVHASISTAITDISGKN